MFKPFCDFLNSVLHEKPGLWGVCKWETSQFPLCQVEMKTAVQPLNALMIGPWGPRTPTGGSFAIRFP